MSIDVETQDLTDVLANHGYRPERPTFFVWEAVTQYLTEAGVRKTFDFLATAAPGSHLVFTYVAQWPRVASVGDRTFSLHQKDLSANSPSPAVRGRTDYRHRC